MNLHSIQRRSLLRGLASGAMAAAGLPAGAQSAPSAQTGAGAVVGTKLVLLGTKGGPRVGGNRSNPANLLLIGGTPYVIDCGYGVARQLVRAGVPLPSVRYVFMTHMHSDHDLELAGLLYGAWSAGQTAAIEVYGPPTTDEMVKSYFDYMKFDFDIRMADEGKPDPRPLVKAHVFDHDGVVFQNAQVKVTAARNHHPPIHDSFALRFDTADRSVVFSGDTNYNEDVIRLAQGADLLVHEAMYLPGVDALARSIPNAKTLREHLLAAHTTTEDVGRVAAAAGVKRLVLSHLVPGDDPSITDEMWLEGVRRHYDGPAVVGKDLMVL